MISSVIAGHRTASVASGQDYDTPAAPRVTGNDTAESSSRFTAQSHSMQGLQRRKGKEQQAALLLPSGA